MGSKWPLLVTRACLPCERPSHGRDARVTRQHSLYFLLAVCLVSVAEAAPERDASLSPTRDVIERYVTDLGALERRDNVLGSRSRYDRLDKFDQDELTALHALDFDSLDQAGKIDYLLLQNKLNFDRKQLDRRHKQFDDAADLLPFGKPIIELEEARHRVEPMNPQAAAEALDQIRSQVRKLHTDLDHRDDAHRPTAVLANRAANFVDELRQTLKHWHHFYDGYDPQFTWWTREPYPKADKELEEYREFLRTKFAGYGKGDEDPVIGDPIGRQALLDALAAEMIPYTPEELIDIANREFAWCDAEMKKATQDLGCETWHQALAKVSQMHANPGDQPQLIKNLADEATRFVEDRDLVTVPPLCKETWRIEMMSVERQKVNPYFTGGEEIRVSYPTDTMSTEDKLMSMRGNNFPFCRATVFHELIPGHCLQLFMADRYNAHRKAFTTPFLIEGWALYWEMRFWDLGFPRTPEERVGMLFWRAHRCARIIFLLKFHLGQMTAQEAIDFLVDRVGHERRNATAEVRRSVYGEYGPLYQAAYMLGALQLRALRQEVVGAGKMTDKQFNDAVLRENSIPVALIRASLTNQKLTRDFHSDWRFYDELKQEKDAGARP